jgi:hypothetical protein
MSTRVPPSQRRWGLAGSPACGRTVLARADAALGGLISHGPFLTPVDEAAGLRVSHSPPARFCEQDASWDARQLELEHARACDLAGRGVEDAEGAGACSGYGAPDFSPSDASELGAISCEVCTGWA